jgi:hypothetical protein
LSFANNSKGLEWKYGRTDYQDRFTAGYVRAVLQGLQGGLFPTVLDGTTDTESPEEKTWVTRTMLALFLPHEVKPTLPRGSDDDLIVAIYTRLFDFGTHEPDCRYTAYWNPQNPVRTATPGLLVSTYRRGGKLLAVVANDHGDSGSATLTVSEPVAAAKNLESDTPLPCAANTITLPLKRHDFALVEILLAAPKTAP